MTGDVNRDPFEQPPLPGVRSGGLDSLLTNPEDVRRAFGGSGQRTFVASNADAQETAQRLLTTDMQGIRQFAMLPDAGDRQLERAMRFIQDKPNPEHVLELACVALADRGKPKLAEEVGKELLALREERYGPQSAPVSLTLSLLGDFCAADGRFDAAKEYFRRGVEVSKVAYKDKDNAMTALHLGKMGLADAELGNFKEADKELKESLRIHEKLDVRELTPAVIRHLALTYLRHADVLERLGEKQEALKQEKKGVELLRKLEKDEKEKKAKEDNRDRA